MKHVSFVRWSGWCMVLSALISLPLALYATRYEALVQEPLASPTTTSIIWNSLATMSRTLAVIGLIGLARSGAGGRRWWGTVGVFIMVLGAALNVLVSGSEVFKITLNSLMLDGQTETLSGLGMTIFGVAVLVERRWKLRWRFLPLINALYGPAVVIPAAIFGGPSVLHWAVASGAVVNVLLGIAMIAEAGRSVQVAPTVSAAEALYPRAPVGMREGSR